MRLQTLVPSPPQTLLDALAQVGIRTDTDLLFSATPVDIFRKLPSGTLSLHDFHSFVAQVTRQAAAPAVCGDVLFEQGKRREESDLYSEPTTGVRQLDQLLGGLAPPRVIEVSGDRGSGKSVFLCASVVLRHLSSDHNLGALWIDTTGEFSADRIPPLLESYEGCAVSTTLERLQVALAFDIETAQDVLEMIRTTLSTHPDAPPVVRCVVVDTVTALLSPLLSAVSSQGHAIMTTFMRQLQTLAQSFSLTILVINSSTRCTPRNPDSVFATTDRKPALGPSFTFLTDTTLWLARHDTAEDGSATHVAEIFRSRMVVRLSTVDVSYSVGLTSM
ncbi:P-loop containing nucleoside triphosphate hydrolase protein [Fomitopsis serialis]|uniref:P-loop containing nucleoside triphosphate hydrolase protein n=1 Tax=Fomitopsis serialis TaxID=139415 RepID=UPI0020075FB7|nr:P-loop containing nucleoside triphosphate hydrolase protein [Neoantrodia serialis]KAH9928751.1 P-loop containing nucleoside triphosphate hydrolase protein [Neoantrodia serialis]